MKEFFVKPTYSLSNGRNFWKNGNYGCYVEKVKGLYNLYPVQFMQNGYKIISGRGAICRGIGFVAKTGQSFIQVDDFVCKLNEKGII